MSKTLPAFIITFFFTFSFCFAQSDGTPDATFGTGGKTTQDCSTNQYDLGGEAALLSDGSIVVGGTSYIGSDDFSLCCFTSAGALNTNWGTNGIYKLDITNNSFDDLMAVALDSSERIVACGYSIQGQDEYIIVLRLNTNGTPDGTFGSNGLVQLNPAAASVGYDVAIQPDGKIVVAGYVSDGLTSEKMCVVRLNDDGTYDGAFGDNGVWEGSADPTWDSKAYAVAVQADGKILLGGYLDLTSSDDEFVVGRITAGGAVDNSFNSNGFVVKNTSVTNDDIVTALAVQPDGKILFAGASNFNCTVCRLNSDGTDDAAFATNGTYINALQSGNDALYAIAIQNDEQIVAAGFAKNGSTNDFVLLRLAADGTPDNGFGSNGVVYTDFSSGDDLVRGLIIQPDQRIVASGAAEMPASGYDFAVCRYAMAPTGMSAEVFGSNMSISPNPSDGNFTITLPYDGEWQYSITDISGKEIESGTMNAAALQTSLHVEHHASGILFLTMKNEAHAMVLHGKVEVNRGTCP